MNISEVEFSLGEYRKYQSIILRDIIGYLGSNDKISDPFFILLKLFSRVKSADSIIEKIKRKNLDVQNLEDLHSKVKDILGFRVVAKTYEDMRMSELFMSTLQIDILL